MAAWRTWPQGSRASWSSSSRSSEEHAEELWEAAQAPEIWTWLDQLGASRELFDEWIGAALEAARPGARAPSRPASSADGVLVGSSRYLNVRPADRVVEIGWTWLNPRPGAAASTSRRNC